MSNMKHFKFNLFGTLYEIQFTVKITKRVPKFVTVKPDTKWIYAGETLKVDSVYSEGNEKFGETKGRYLRLSLLNTKFNERPDGSKYTTTVIHEKDLIPHY